MTCRLATGARGRSYLFFSFFLNCIPLSAVVIHVVSVPFLFLIPPLLDEGKKEKKRRESSDFYMIPCR